MNAALAHVALEFSDVPTTVSLLRDVFDMHITEEKNGTVWLSGGIQLIPSTSGGGSWPDHIAIEVDDLERVISKAKKHGCHILGDNNNWVKLPEGLVIEVLTMKGSKK